MRFGHLERVSDVVNAIGCHEYGFDVLNAFWASSDLANTVWRCEHGLDIVRTVVTLRIRWFGFLC